MSLSRGQRFWAGIAGVILTILVAGLVTAWFLVHKCLPQTSGVIELEGLQGAVTVVRDAYGVPHIEAENEHDLFMAVGFVQAQDRLWQMDLLRRVSEGRLSEILGSRALEADKMLRTVGMMRVARRIADSLDAESRRILEAYTAGVNQFIQKNLHNYPIEFVLLGYEPYPWKVEHSIGISRVMAWQLNMGWMVDLNYQRIADTIGLPMAAELLPGYPEDGPFVVPDRGLPISRLDAGGSVLTSQSVGLSSFYDANTALQTILGTLGSAFGSNAWVISGSKSGTGKPILANDPHLAQASPPTWYEMHLSGAGWNVEGFALPGTPVVVLGNNARIAWGFTNLMCDDADFFEETLDGDRYLDQGTWKDLQIIYETVRVEDTAEVSIPIRSTRRGPLVTEIVPTRGRAVSMQWTGLQPSFEMTAIAKMNRASNWMEFRDACSLFKVPGQNAIYADVDGNIGYQCMGAVPVRKGGEGIFLGDGASGRNDWTAAVPFKELPFSFNPPEGYIASANNKVVGTSYPHYVGRYWEHSSRARRLNELLSGDSALSVESVRQIQMDFYSHHAREVMDVVLPVLLRDSAWTPSDDRQPLTVHQGALLTLKHWDCQMDVLSRGAALFNTYFQNLLRQIYLDEMGDELFRGFIKLSNVPTRVTTQLLAAPASRWWDNRRTGAVESRDDIIRKTFEETVAEMAGRFGDDASSWMWGDLHSVEFGHLIGQQKPFDYVFNVGPFSIGGNTTTVNNTEYGYADSTFRTVISASMRRIVDLADPLRPQSVLPLGQSGQPFSRHYDDQTDLWLSGQLKTVFMKADEIEGETLTLVPEKR